MYKFILKFYFLFIVTISVMFFSLVFYQKQGMDRNQPQIHPPREFMMNPIEEMPPQPMHPMPSNEPSPVIPFLFIIGISSVFILCFLRYIGKSYVKPLNLIQENLKNIKNDNFDIVFENEDQM